MRRVLVIGTMVALMLAAASPAFADTAIGGDVDFQFVDASQTQAATALQVNRGDATSTASGLGSAADASIDQGLTIDQSQWNGGTWWTW